MIEEADSEDADGVDNEFEESSSDSDSESHSE